MVSSKWMLKIDLISVLIVSLKVIMLRSLLNEYIFLVMFLCDFMLCRFQLIFY